MNCHDVRRLVPCSRTMVCAGIGVDLLRISPTEYAHARCLVLADGWDAYESLPYREIMKTTVEDLSILGITLDRALEIAAAAKKRVQRPPHCLPGRSRL